MTASSSKRNRQDEIGSLVERAAIRRCEELTLQDDVPGAWWCLSDKLSINLALSAAMNGLSHYM